MRFRETSAPVIRWNFGTQVYYDKLAHLILFFLKNVYIVSKFLCVCLILNTWATANQIKLWFSCFWNVLLVLNHALVYCVHLSQLLRYVPSRQYHRICICNHLDQFYIIHFVSECNFSWILTHWLTSLCTEHKKCKCKTYSQNTASAIVYSKKSLKLKLTSMQPS